MTKKLRLNQADFLDEPEQIETAPQQTAQSVATMEQPKYNEPAAIVYSTSEPVTRYEQPQAQPQVQQYTAPAPTTEIKEEPPTKQRRGDLTTINLSGHRQELEALCYHETKQKGKRVSLSSYILEIIEKDIAGKQDIIKKYL